MRKNIIQLKSSFNKYLTIAMAAPFIGLGIVFLFLAPEDLLSKIMAIFLFFFAGLGILIAKNLERVWVDFANTKIFIKNDFKAASIDFTNIRRIADIGWSKYGRIYRIDFFKPTAFGEKIHLTLLDTPKEKKAIKTLISIVNHDYT